ncbi:hypothetical protein BC826DRAFT_1101019 [Russula brevipes]|nr:hypothetical protein BC826DRAFT_1101019 [Russula brevipes]
MDFFRPPQLPTPPETDKDFVPGGHHTLDLMNPPVADPQAHPFVGAPLRRVSTLAYHSSPLRDPRDRPSVRQSRWLIVVIPPTSLAQDHGPLGHTLISGPSHRLSQGIVMPLQPTMYGQLNAIAREFNFPSPVGLCLYLHIAEHGSSMTPRISDEIGQHYGMPICGRIEFDIDRRKARWLDSWLTSDRRHAVDVPVSVPPSLSHWHADSKNSVIDEHGDERPEVVPGLPTVSRSRHIPKKLSLVDRLETLSLTSSVANAMAGNGAVHVLSTSLAKVLQDEPKTAKIALENRVETWRASSSVAATPMAVIGQTSLDPIHIPNNIQLSDIDILADTDGVDGIDLNEFAWSVSSPGLPDYEPLASAVSTSRIPSVHLDRRLEGSVLLSPSTATSWGPESLDNSPSSILFRLPSPDIGRRVTEDCPPTPSTATSWGPEELLHSPASVQFRLPSPDLGWRLLEDCPPTPSTATSWGPEELLYSPASVEFHLPSPDLGRRMLEDCPPTPTTLPSWGLEEPFHSVVSMASRDPLHMAGIWPYTLLMPTTWTTQGDTSRKSRSAGLHPSDHVFPYFLAPNCPTWTFVWPFFEAENASRAQSSRGDTNAKSRTAGLVFPYFSTPSRPTWTFIWPFFEAENASRALSSQGDTSAKSRSAGLHPTENASRALSSRGDTNAKSRTAGLVFPYFSTPSRPTWTFIWPFFEAENASTALSSQGDTSAKSRSAGLHPSDHVFPFFLTPSRPTWTFVWPFFEAETASRALSSQFPHQNLAIVTCDATRLHFKIFPERIYAKEESTVPNGHLQSRLKLTSLQFESGYPTLAIYPPVYPYLSMYPPLPTDLAARQEAEPSLTHSSYSHVKSGTQYPYFDLYPAGYPTDLMYIYPSVLQPKSATSLPIRLPSIYPVIEPYPPQYPFMTPYPARAAPSFGHPLHSANPSNDRQARSVNSSGPPDAPLYPAFDIYPAVAVPSEVKVLNIHLPQVYPRITPYPAVYPELDLYPPVFTEKTSGSPETELMPRYPHIRAYPAVYPWFEIYPGHVSAGENDGATSHLFSLLQPVYPQFDIYPAVYPYFDIYRTGYPKKEDREAPLSVMLSAQYPALSLYPPAYPHFEIYPPITQGECLTLASDQMPHSPHASTSDAVTLSHIPRRVRRTHKELHEEVFGAGAPVGESVRQVTDKPLGGIQGRGRARSGTVNAHPALPHILASPPTTLPPVPPLPTPKRPSLRVPSHYPEAQHSDLSIDPSEARSRPTDQPTSFHVRLNSYSSPARQAGSIVRSDSLTSGNSSPRRDRQSHRPRDSLVLEKARLLDHLHALSHGDASSTVDKPTVPPVPQLPSDIPQPQTHSHSKNPFA